MQNTPVFGLPMTLAGQSVFVAAKFMCCKTIISVPAETPAFIKR